MGIELHLIKGGREKQQSASEHGNSWLYSYFHLLIKEILTAANINRVRALAESVQFLNVYTHGCGRDNNPQQSLTFPMRTLILSNLEKRV